MKVDDFLPELIEGFRSAGRKGGVVAVLVGAVFLAGGLSLAKDAKEDPRHHGAGFAAAGILIGAGAILGGLWLTVTGGSNEPVSREEPNEPLASVPLPYALCLQCPRVVKSWRVVACTRCGGDLVDIRSEEDEQWAREALAASRKPSKAPRHRR
ncbi:hypothetical protein JQX13_51855 [Archangium violaceum]|uniref:hypothetical protein n=1 Tax=Archangium violaceum TaxID=83451 RepID=UPI00193B3774|nr:hypothetical protein [Archangium violaceum]QRK08330.1 hypothetical protein JQX13_51855 [Archangium violaceum]